MANIIDRNRPEQVELKPLEIEGMGRPDDSRVKFGLKETHPIFPLERTYCSNCGAPYGYVSQESSTYISAGEVIVFCDKCDRHMNSKMGKLPLQVAGDKNTRDFVPPVLRAGSLPSKLGE